MKMKPMLCDETEAGIPWASFAARAKRGASVRLFLLELHRDVYELCCLTKPLRIGSFHDQFRYSPEQESLGSVLLRDHTPYGTSRASTRSHYTFHSAATLVELLAS